MGSEKTPYSHYLWPNRRNFRVIREIGVEELDGDVRFHGTEIEMWLFRACAMKNMQYNHRYSRVGEISVSYRKLLSRITIVTSYLASAMGQIPRSTERIADFIYFSVKHELHVNKSSSNTTRLQNTYRVACLKHKTISSTLKISKSQQS